MVEEEGASVGEADVLVCEAFALGEVGWEGEDIVVNLASGGALWHRCSEKWRVDWEVEVDLRRSSAPGPIV